jgi:hypothetical protein
MSNEAKSQKNRAKRPDNSGGNHEKWLDPPNYTVLRRARVVFAQALAMGRKNGIFQKGSKLAGR